MCFQTLISREADKFKTKTFPFKILNTMIILLCYLMGLSLKIQLSAESVMSIVCTYNLNRTKVFLPGKKCPFSGIQEFLKGTNGKKFKM